MVLSTFHTLSSSRLPLKSSWKISVPNPSSREGALGGSLWLAGSFDTGSLEAGSFDTGSLVEGSLEGGCLRAAGSRSGRRCQTRLCVASRWFSVTLPGPLSSSVVQTQCFPNSPNPIPTPTTAAPSSIRHTVRRQWPARTGAGGMEDVGVNWAMITTVDAAQHYCYCKRVRTIARRTCSLSAIEEWCVLIHRSCSIDAPAMSCPIPFHRLCKGPAPTGATKAFRRPLHSRGCCIALPVKRQTIRLQQLSIGATMNPTPSRHNQAQSPRSAGPQKAGDTGQDGPSREQMSRTNCPNRGT